MTLFRRFSGPPWSDIGTHLLLLSIVLLLVGFWAITVEVSDNILGKYQICNGMGPPLTLQSTYIAGGVLTFVAVLLFICLRVDLQEQLLKDSFKKYADQMQEAAGEDKGFQEGGTGASFWEVHQGKNESSSHLPEVEFQPSKGLTTAEAEKLLKEWGRNELSEKVTPTWLIILRLLTGPMPVMLWIAAVIEAAIANYADMGILLGIQFINAGISFYETTKAGNAVAALKASLKPLATVKRDGMWLNMDAGAVVPGDLVLLAAGSAVPADCYVNEGEIEVDQSAMTGESLPVKFRRGDICKMGSTVVRGEVDGTVETTGQHTFFGKTAAMLSSVDSSGGSLQTLLLQMMTVLVTLSLLLCVIAFIYLVVAGEADNSTQLEVHRHSNDEIIKEALSFAVVVLVASIPLAVEIVTTTTLAMGSRALSSHGAIVTRLASIEELAGMDMLCSDKTGTLTLNKMVIQDDCPVFSPGEDKESIMFQAALAAKWKEPPRDALDTMVLKTGLLLPQADEPVDPKGKVNREALDKYTQLDFLPFDPRTKRTEGKLQGPDGNIFRITKGAPHVILNLSANKEEIMDAVEKKVHELGTRGIRSLAVARAEGEDGPWRFLGILTFLDPPRPDTKQTIADANAFGVEVKMITGDHHTIAVETARMLGMGTLIQGPNGLPMLGEGGKVPESLADHYGALIVPSCGFAQVFPEHKFLIVECLRQVGFRVGMTGDGVNDAPALKRADVGIAVAGSTDAARAAADIVLTDEGLSVCIVAIKIAREIFSRLKNFVNYRISATLQLLFFFFIAVFALPPRDFYERNGINGVDMVSTNPLYGGDPTITVFDSVYPFNLPRQSPTCPGGLLNGEKDPRLAPYQDLVTQKSHWIVESITVSDGNVQTKPDEVTRTTIKYFKINAMEPRYPGIAGYNPGCNIVIPICESQNICLDADRGGYMMCPTYQICHEWPFFFQLPVLMLMLITLLNDGALISIGYDHVRPSPTPERWNIRLIFAVSIMLGAVACGSSLLLLWAALDSNNPDGAFAGMGLPPMEYGKIITMIYLKVSLSDFLTLFSARTQDSFFFLGPPPNIILFGAASISLIISTFLASFWPPGLLDGLPVMGLALGDYALMPLWVWIYCLIWWIIQDALKVLTIRYCRDHPFFRVSQVDRRKYRVLNAATSKEAVDSHKSGLQKPSSSDGHGKSQSADADKKTTERKAENGAAHAKPPEAVKVPSRIVVEKASAPTSAAIAAAGSIKPDAAGGAESDEESEYEEMEEIEEIEEFEEYEDDEEEEDEDDEDEDEEDEDEVIVKVEVDAKTGADEKTKKEAVEKAKREAEAKAKKEAEEKARKQVEEKARKEAEAKAKKEAEEKVRKEAEAKAKKEAEEKARKEAEAKAKKEAEEKARKEAEAKAKKEAEEKARKEAEEKAKEAEAKAKQEAETKARKEAEENVKQNKLASATDKKGPEEKLKKTSGKLEQDGAAEISSQGAHDTEGAQDQDPAKADTVGDDIALAAGDGGEAAEGTKKKKKKGKKKKESKEGDKAKLISNGGEEEDDDAA